MHAYEVRRKYNVKISQTFHEIGQFILYSYTL